MPTSSSGNDGQTNKKKNGVGRNEEECATTDYAEDTLCGIGSWKPKWLQPFATAKSFVIIFCIMAILQGALFTYMVGVMSTLEKRFSFETKISGMILIADNISQMFVSPLVGWLGSKYNRALLIAFGELVVALSCLIATVPYFLYGPALHLLDKQIIDTMSNQTKFDLCFDKEDETCAVAIEDVDQSFRRYLTVPIILLWFSSFANGLGYTAFYTIGESISGLPYVDDNIKKTNSPLYLSTISTIRLLGPMLGFVLSGYFLQFYENPFMDPGITKKDPRWIGAWWLGFLFLGLFILLFTIPLFMFPKRFRDVKEPPPTELEFTKADDAWRAFKRLMKNKLFVFHIVGSTFRLVGYLGYYINKPKYIELQYRQSASSASFFTGATSVVTMALGTMAGGVFISKWRPNARWIAIFIASVELFQAFGLLTASFLQCPTPQFNGLELINQPELGNTCFSGCECSTKVYQPICDADGVTNYFSPCYAGCRRYEPIPGSSKLAFHNCSCIETANFAKPRIEPRNPTTWLAQSGLCANDCNMFVWFIILLSLSNMVASTARTGDTLLMLRSIDLKDKSFAFGVMGSIFAIFAFIPYPLIFGAIIDSTCLVWEQSCGSTGNCWLYDIKKFREYLHYSSFTFIIVGLSFELGTIMYANRARNIYDENEDGDGKDTSEPDAIEAHELRSAKMPGIPMPIIEQQLSGVRKGSMSAE